MPSVAQQDYIKIECLDRPFFNDAESLKKLRRAINRGTIFDVIIKGKFVPNKDFVRESRILAFSEGQGIIFFSTENIPTTPSTRGVGLSEENYDFLEYVQKECDALFGSPYPYLPFPGSQIVDNKDIAFFETHDSENIIFSTEDGFAYEMEIDDYDRISAVKKSSITAERAKEETDSDYIMILPEEKAVEMIGIGI